MMLGVKALLCVCLAAYQLSWSEGSVQPLEYLPRDLQGYLDTCHSGGDLSKQTAQLVFWTAINQYTSKFIKSRPNLTPQQITYLHQNLRDAMAPLFKVTPRGRKKRQALGPRVRREVRALSVDERRRYFAAVNALKVDTRLPPNVYDFLAAYHQGDNIQRAHFGPAFPSWHRLYLWIYEYFLRLHDPTVSVPFWASVLDTDMQDSTQSVMWSPAFFGNGDGDIRTGPFRRWPQISAATTFTRNIQGGELYTVDGINRILSRSRNSEILIPTALADSNFEIQHGAGHIFVGGSMNNLESAARDPVFFSHHAFVDQIWERFRANQRRRGIDPESDYPFDQNDSRFSASHSPTANAGFEGLSGASTWTQNLGYINDFSNFVTYEDVPACPRCANSPYLFCNQNLNPPRCVSRTEAELGMSGLLNELDTTPTPNRGKRQAMASILPPDRGLNICPRTNLLLHDIDTKRFGLSYSLATSQHTNDWSYIPVKVIAKRPEKFQKFKKYSLYNEVYNSQLGLDSLFVRPGIQKEYSTCEKLQDTVGEISIVSYGLNYDGYAEEYVIVDNRLGVSEGNGFVPIKKPSTSMPSEVIIAAFDSCGRVCKPYCRQGSMNQYFSGAIRVSTAPPQQFSDSYADATLHMWDIPSASSCPKVIYENIPVSFFCEYTDTWIWGSPNSTVFGGMNLGGIRPPLPQPHFSGHGMAPQVLSRPSFGPSHRTSVVSVRTPPIAAGHSAGRGLPHRPAVPFHGSPPLAYLAPPDLYIGRG